MKKFILVLVLILLIPIGVGAAEKAELTTPIVSPSTTSYEISRIILDVRGSMVFIELHSSIGTPYVATYRGPVAKAMMRALNKADLSTKSLKRRIFERLIADGKLPAATVTGVPE